MERQDKRRLLFPKMDLNKLPKQTPVELPPLMDSLIAPLQSDNYVLKGNLADEIIEDGEVKDICEGVDVVVYGKSSARRPWVGRVAERISDEEFSVHWFARQGKRNTFTAMMKSVIIKDS